MGSALLAETKARLRAMGIEQVVTSHYAFNDASAALMQEAGLEPLYVVARGSS